MKMHLAKRIEGKRVRQGVSKSDHQRTHKHLQDFAAVLTHRGRQRIRKLKSDIRLCETVSPNGRCSHSSTVHQKTQHFGCSRTPSSVTRKPSMSQGNVTGSD